MTYFYACIGCKRKSDCNSLTAIKGLIRGHGITSIKHTCKWRDPMFSCGDPVIVRVYMYSDGDYEAGEQNDVYGDFRGVFIQQKGPRGVCFISPGTLREGCGLENTAEDAFVPRDGNVGYVKVPLKRIRLRPGLDRLSRYEMAKFLPRDPYPPKDNEEAYD